MGFPLVEDIEEVFLSIFLILRKGHIYTTIILHIHVYPYRVYRVLLQNVSFIKLWNL